MNPAKARKQALKDQWKANETAKAEAELPAPAETLLELLAWVDDRLAETPCDHTNRHTLRFIEDKRLNREAVLDWLADHGGHCDCEVSMNVPDSSLILRRLVVDESADDDEAP